jgi:uncharacterized protein
MMNTQNKQLQLNVGFIAQGDIGYSREFLFDCPSLFIQPDLQLSGLKGMAAISRTSEGLLFQGEFQADIHATCCRCLTSFDQHLTTDFAELFTFQSHAQDDTELIYPEDGHIDLGPIIREYLLLEFPINPICKTDCQGLCPICGKNLNQGVCDHRSDPIDPRMSVLKKLLDSD